MTFPLPFPKALSAVLLATLLGSSAQAADSGPVGGWVKDRAQEYDVFLKAGAGSRAGEGSQLWRERPAGSQLPEFTAPTSLAPLIRAVRPGVVNINALTNDNGKNGRSLGSGFIISPDGYVVTNNHVIERAQRIEVRLADGRDFLAETVGRDPSTDVALLRLLGVKGPLPFTYLGDSDVLEVGDWVLAIGNPFGLDYSVSQGIISAKERVIGVSAFDDFLQVDAPINPGNSGGPLFNMKGEVIGVTTAIVSQGQGIGFAVPISLVKDLLAELGVEGGWLGLSIHEARDEGGLKGAMVLDVAANSPAAAAGIQPGDRLVAVNGRPIATYLQLLRRVALLPPGHEAKLTLVGAGGSREVTVRLGVKPSPDAAPPPQQQGAASAPNPWGLALRELVPQLAEGLKLAPYSGVLVVGVPASGPAAQAGFRSGDLITEINNRRVQDLRGLRAALERTGDHQPALVRVQRGDEERYVAVGP